jgi:tetratricopeptide (TPR) repeat protein
VLTRMGDYEAAAKACERAAGMRAPNILISYQMMDVLAGGGRYDEALWESDRLLADPNGSPGAKRLRRAELLRRTGRTEDTLTEADRAIEHLPGTASAWWIKAAVLGELSRPDEALAAADRALRLGPLWADVHVLRGWLLHLSGRSQDGLKAIERALVLEPDLDMAHIRAGMILAATGKTEEAERRLAEARKWAGPDHWTQSKLAELQAAVAPPATQTQPLAPAATQPQPAAEPHSAVQSQAARAVDSRPDGS